MSMKTVQAANGAEASKIFPAVRKRSFRSAFFWRLASINLKVKEEINPTEFISNTLNSIALYLLDEIDAALDEINGHRIAKIVSETLAKTGSQIIAISVPNFQCY
jgi:hypothetical protein